MGSLNHIPSLAIEPQQQPDPLSQYGKLQSIQALSAQRQQQQAMAPGQLEEQRQAIETAALDNQQKRKAAAQTDAMSAAFQAALTPDATTGHPTFDRDKVLTSIAASGNGSLIPQLTEKFNQIDKSAAELSDAKDKHAIATQDYFGDLASEVKANGYSPAALGVALAHATANGYGPQAQQIQQQYAQNPDSIKQWVDQAIAGSPKQREVSAQEMTAQARRDQADKESTPPLATQESAAWLAQNPGKTLVDYQKYEASLHPIAQINAANAAGGGLAQAAIDQAAERYATTGQLPPSSRGVAGIAQNRTIMNRAAELHPSGSITANSAEYKANSDSLKKIQSNFDQVSAFENTAGKNLDVFLKTAKPVVDSGSPWINKPLREIAQGALGSSDQAAFNAARQTAVTEIAKVLNSSNASGVLSDSARHEVEGLIGPTATLKQIVSAATVLKQDMANRHQSYADQIADIKGRLSGQSPTTTPPATSSGGYVPPGAVKLK